jgi:hypothetical protein
MHASHATQVMQIVVVGIGVSIFVTAHHYGSF